MATLTRTTGAQANPPTIHVPDRLTAPHPLVKASRGPLSQAKVIRNGILVADRRGALDIRVSKKQLSRALRIADALIKALEERGYEVRNSDGDWRSTVAIVAGQEIAFSIEEKVEEIKTPEAARSGLHYAPREVKPTGRLVLRINEASSFGPSRRTWADGARQRVEDCLGKFIVAMEAVSGPLRERREKLERDRREHALAWERRREEEERRKRMEHEVGAWKYANDVRHYLRALQEAARGHPDARLRDWISWGLSYADRIDPIPVEVPDRARSEPDE